MKLNKIWHCARPKLAQSYLALLDAGPVVSTSIFAPRRTGKTVFLRQDLTPAAQKAGYCVAYADLWQTRLSPGASLVRGLEEASEPKAFGQVDLSDGKKESTELALRIDDLIAKLCARSPLLLLVDEAQELAKTKDNELVATALRTAITKHRDHIRVVFTGSSRTQLAHVFSNTDSPLYSVGAAIQDFPLLGRELVEFVAEKFETATQRKLDLAEAWHQFQAFKQQPEPFLNAVVALMLDPSTTLAKACQAERTDQDKAENHEGTWSSLDAVQKQLVKLLADDATAKPFSKSVMTMIATQVGVATLDTSTIQFALRKLGEKTVLTKSPRGNYVFESDAFERWVKTLG